MTRKSKLPNKPQKRRLTSEQKERIDRVYLDVLIWYCRCFLEYLKVVKQQMAARVDSQIVSANIQCTLGFAACVTKVLWCRSRNHERVVANARARRLRRRIGISRDHVLNNVEVRNAFEHLDARLDIWATTTKMFSMAMFNCAPRKAVGRTGLDDGDRFIEYYPKPLEVRILDVSVDFDKLEKSIKRVYAGALTAKQEIDTGLTSSAFQPHASFE